MVGIIVVLLILAIVGIVGTIYTVYVAQDRAIDTLRAGLIEQIVDSDLGPGQKADLRAEVDRLATAYREEAAEFDQVRDGVRNIDPILKLGTVASRLRLLALSSDYPAERKDRIIDSLRKWIFLGLTDRVEPKEIRTLYDALVDKATNVITLKTSVSPQELSRLLRIVERKVDSSSVTFPKTLDLDLSKRVRQIVNDCLSGSS